MNKNTVYILQKDYEYPNGKVYKGVGHTIKEWQRYFPYLIGRDFDIKTDWFKPKEEPKKLDKEKEFQKVLKCLKNNKVVVDTRDDGIYIRLAGRESDGEAFTLHFALAYPFPKVKTKEEVNESKPTEQFQWTNELVMEFVNFHDEQKGIHWLSEDIEKFKQSKSKKEEPQWEILEIESYGGEIRKLIDGEYRLYTDGVGFTATYLLQRSDSKIKTVKRFPDNTVWSVDGSYFINGYMATLKRFELSENGKMIVYFNGLNIGYELSELPTEKAPKEEQVPIKVEIMEFGYGKPQENKGKFYVANFNLPNNAKLPTEKYQSIKSAIEDVLNGKTEYGLLVATGNIESYNKGYSMGYKDANKYNDKKYTESELLQARRDAFYAGRSFDCWNVSSHQYAKFEDYINSLK